MLIEIEEAHTKQALPIMVGQVRDYGYDCFAIVNGSIRPFGRIDLDRHHRMPASRDDYIFNFIFLPK